MKKEKIIRQQAREALKGNFAVLIAGSLAVAAAVILLENVLYLIALPLGFYDLEADAVVAGKEAGMAVLMTGVIALAVALSPFVNGLLRAAGNAVTKGSCSVTDLFCFFQSPLRYFKTLAVNLGLGCLYAVLTTPLRIIGSLWFADGVFAVVWTAVTLCWSVFVFLLFLHYPLAAYALDDSHGALHYLFGYIGFSFRRFGALLTLLLSMAGWLALGFFIVPLLYTVPYLLTALMNSARWLFAMEN